MTDKNMKNDELSTLKQKSGRYKTMYYAIMTVSVVFGLTMVFLMLGGATPLALVPLGLSVFLLYKGNLKIMGWKDEVDAEIARRKNN